MRVSYFNEEEGNSGIDVNNRFEANTGNEAINSNKTNTGNGANNGNEANTGSDRANNGNEAINSGNEANYYGRTNDGAGAFQYHARGNEASHSQYNYANNFYHGGGLHGDGGGYYGNFQSWMPTTPWMPPMSNPYPWCWPIPPPLPPGGLPSQSQEQMQPVPAPQPATSQASQSSRKRHRETIQELNTDPTEDKVDPFLPAQEHSELLDESANDDSNSDMEEPPPKKKFIPNEQLLGLLKAYTVRPLKNDSRGRLLISYQHYLVTQPTLQNLMRRWPTYYQSR